MVDCAELFARLDKSHVDLAYPPQSGHARLAILSDRQHEDPRGLRMRMSSKGNLPADGRYLDCCVVQSYSQEPSQV
jgi:hypothetical protein